VKQLIFVYNAKAGFMHGMMDLVHKTASPKTYPCKLCMVTYSGAKMNKLWKRYVASLGLPSIFMHKNEFARAYSDQRLTFPAVLLKDGDMLSILISSTEFGKMANLNDLISLLELKLHAAKLK